MVLYSWQKLLQLHFLPCINFSTCFDFTLRVTYVAAQGVGYIIQRYGAIILVRLI